MKLRKFFFLLAALSFSLVTQAQNYPKREFRAAWIQTVNGQFKGMSADMMPMGGAVMTSAVAVPQAVAEWPEGNAW